MLNNAQKSHCTTYDISFCRNGFACISTNIGAFQGIILQVFVVGSGIVSSVLLYLLCLLLVNELLSCFCADLYNFPGTVL